MNNEISAEDIIKFMQKNINKITKAQKKEVINTIPANLRENVLKECSEGTIVILSAVPFSTICQMYQKLQAISIEKQSQTNL